MLQVMSAHAQTKAEVKKAKEAYQTGIAKYQQEEWGEALEAFLLAQEIIPDTGNLYNIARCYHQLGQYKKALEYYELYVDQGGPKKGKVSAYIKEIPAKVKIKTEPDGANLFVDSAWEPAGVSPATLEIPPGKHKITAMLEGYKPGSRTVVLSPADSYSYTILLDKAPEGIHTASAPEPPKSATGGENGTTAEPSGASTATTGVERKLDLGHMLLGGGGVAIPIAFQEVYAFVSIDLSWEMRIGEYGGVGIGLDMQVASNGQIFVPYLFGGGTFQLPRSFHVFVRGGIGVAAARLPEDSTVDSDKKPVDMTIRIDGGVGWSHKGFNLRLVAISFDIYPGAGGLTEDASAQYTPRLLLGYLF